MRSILAIIAGSLLLGCADSPAEPAKLPPKPAEIRVSPSVIHLVQGDSVQVTISVIDTRGDSANAPSISATVEDTRIAVKNGSWIKAAAVGHTAIRFQVDTIVTEVPVQVDAGFTSVSSSYRYSCGLRSIGDAYCWGLFYQAPGESLSSPLPRKVVVPAGGFDSISVGWVSQCGLDANGKAYCWGLKGSLGDGSRAPGVESVPAPVLGNHRFRQIDVGVAVSCGVTLVGELFCWESGSPRQIASSQPLKRVAVGFQGGCAIDEMDGLWCWGQRLVGNAEERLQQVMPGRAFRHVTVGGWDSHACAVTHEGTAFCWGNNVLGSLGDGSGVGERESPVAVAGGHVFTTVETFSWATCGLTDAGKPLCWGALPRGSGALNRSHVPSELSTGLTYRAIDVGMNFYCGITDPGHVYCAGDGQAMGDGSPASRAQPSRVMDPVYLER